MEKISKIMCITVCLALITTFLPLGTLSHDTIGLSENVSPIPDEDKEWMATGVITIIIDTPSNSSRYTTGASLEYEMEASMQHLLHPEDYDPWESGFMCNHFWWAMGEFIEMMEELLENGFFFVIGPLIDPPRFTDPELVRQPGLDPLNEIFGDNLEWEQDTVITLPNKEIGQAFGNGTIEKTGDKEFCFRMRIEYEGEYPLIPEVTRDMWEDYIRNKTSQIKLCNYEINYAESVCDHDVEISNGDILNIRSDTTYHYHTNKSLSQEVFLVNRISYIDFDEHPGIIFNNVSLEPALEVESCEGGFGVRATIANRGVGDATVDWDMAIEAPCMCLGGTTEGTIQSLPAGATETVSSGFFLGFGEATIYITVNGCKWKTTAFILGPFGLKVGPNPVPG